MDRACMKGLESSTMNRQAQSSPPLRSYLFSAKLKIRAGKGVEGGAQDAGHKADKSGEVMQVLEHASAGEERAGYPVVHV